MSNNLNYNPDVLTCLANLSNDEVFTPPEIVNQMLDLLPIDLWQNKDAKFLDPVTKSGVFLREIAKRLNIGLAEQIPNQQTRLNHIFKNQLYGISITELTGFLARRSVYCCKKANSPLSICTDFDNEQGNIVFKRIEHTWQGGKCTYCGASQATYDRDDALETHAYQFIHTDNLQDIFGVDMKFDVIIGNPPYQLNVGIEQDNYSIPIYQKFVQQAKKLNPRYLTMIIPARWYAGGRGLDEFRNQMLTDEQIRTIVDFPNAVDCFAGVDISGGVCYFLWERGSGGNTQVKSIRKNIINTMYRPLLEKNLNTFVRFNESISIIRKIRHIHQGEWFDSIVSPQTPFGLYSSFNDYLDDPFQNSVAIYTVKGKKYIHREQILKNLEWVDGIKLYIAKSYGERGDYPYLFIGKPFLGEPNSCCTQTYLHIGGFQNEISARSARDYMATRFFRFCVSLRKNTQDAMRAVYANVPLQDFSESWTDEKLYKKYGLTQEEIAFIESMIRPMELE